MKSQEKFLEIYKREPEFLAFCPYRICPIGAHIDHQFGKITGFAIDKGVFIAYSKKQNGSVELNSLQFDKRAQFHVKDVPPPQKDWADYLRGREWPYKNVKPKIIAEKYLENIAGQGLIDYKFYCFNGEPKFLYVSQGLENHATASRSFLTFDWQFAPFGRSDYKPLDVLPEKPKNFDKMVEFASILSKNIPFLRVDLYEVEGKIYFSELTFSPCGGMMPFNPPEWDRRLGEMLKLPTKNMGKK